VKLFLQATPEERARRRTKERHGSKTAATLNEIIARDRRHRTRALSPLNPADDAIIIVPDQKSLAEVISEAAGLVEEQLGGRRSSG